MANEVVFCGDKKFELAPMRTGQLRELHTQRIANPNRNFMDDNIYTVACCLMNADKESGVPAKTLEQYTQMAEELPCPEYHELLSHANLISGFVVEKKKLGEETATGQK